MYHCPVCNALEPGFAAWVRKRGDSIAVRRIHFPSTGPNDPEAHLYLTLDAMGRAQDMQAKVFHAVHVERIRLNTDDAIIAWVSAYVSELVSPRKKIAMQSAASW